MEDKVEHDDVSVYTKIVDLVVTLRYYLVIAESDAEIFSMLDELQKKIEKKEKR